MKFSTYEIVPMRGTPDPVQCEERNAEFWGLFGIDERDDAYAIGDFSKKQDAEFIRDALLASK